MKKIHLIAMTITLAFVLIGCSDPQKASEENFEVSIQRFLDASFPLCVFRQNFPIEIKIYSDGKVPIYDGMTKLGLLTKTEETRAAVNRYAKPSKVAVYDLTSEGKKYYVSAGNNKANQDAGCICLGKAKVEEIIDFTQPSDMFGATISRVNYTYSVFDLPDWAKNDEIRSLNYQLKKVVEANGSPIKEHADMVLTNKGWKHGNQDMLDAANEKRTK